MNFKVQMLWFVPGINKVSLIVSVLKLVESQRPHGNNETKTCPGKDFTGKDLILHIFSHIVLSKSHIFSLDSIEDLDIYKELQYTYLP